MRYLPSAHADESTIYQEVNDYPQVRKLPFLERVGGRGGGAEMELCLSDQRK